VGLRRLRCQLGGRRRAQGRRRVDRPAGTAWLRLNQGPPVQPGTLGLEPGRLGPTSDRLAAAADLVLDIGDQTWQGHQPRAVGRLALQALGQVPREEAVPLIGPFKGALAGPAGEERRRGAVGRRTRGRTLVQLQVPGDPPAQHVVRRSTATAGIVAACVDEHQQARGRQHLQQAGHPRARQGRVLEGFGIPGVGLGGQQVGGPLLKFHAVPGEEEDHRIARLDLVTQLGEPKDDVALGGLGISPAVAGQQEEALVRDLQGLQRVAQKGGVRHRTAQRGDFLPVVDVNPDQDRPQSSRVGLQRPPRSHQPESHEDQDPKQDAPR